eukprot:11062453-Lingulodinium_polyedra.AAC.1
MKGGLASMSRHWLMATGSAMARASHRGTRREKTALARVMGGASWATGAAWSPPCHVSSTARSTHARTASDLQAWGKATKSC